MTDEPSWDDTAQALLNELHSTLVSKQHDYGHDNILFAGANGVLVRAHDKIARIKNLLGRGGAVAHESLRDSWQDLAGYAIIGMMLNDGTFTRTLACDNKDNRQVVKIDSVSYTIGEWSKKNQNPFRVDL